jgi:AcrR family transcriptional regulator
MEHSKSRRHGERPRIRSVGAGRPRKTERPGVGPVDVEIIGAAAGLFARNGVSATTMAQIADAVGLGVSSVYYYFGNKIEVLERIVHEVNNIPLAIATEAEDRFDDGPHRLHAFIRHDAAALCELPFDINEIHRLAADDRELFADYWSDRQRLVVKVRSFLQQGIEAGHFRTVDLDLGASTILANDEAVQNWYRVRASDARLDTPDEVGVFLADMALRGLLADVAGLGVISIATAEMTRPQMRFA